MIWVSKGNGLLAPIVFIISINYHNQKMVCALYEMSVRWHIGEHFLYNFQRIYCNSHHLIFGQGKWISGKFRRILHHMIHV